MLKRSRKVSPPLFPDEDPSEKIVASNLRLKQRLWDRLDAIAKAEGRSRNEVATYFLEWACTDYEQAKAKAEAEKERAKGNTKAKK